MTLQIGEFPFIFIAEILPEKEPDGQVKAYLPQGRYLNEEHLPLNPYGQGPFCRFKIPNYLDQCGVYALVCDDQVVYIGECVHLARRFNMGYGTINPRNCFVGGQETNCRINHLIFQAVQENQRVSLWFYATAQYKKLESQLLQTVPTPWNR